MSRSGYNDYGWESSEEQWAYIRFRGWVASSIRGKRGQRFLRELIEALDAMPEKRLVTGALKVEMGDRFKDSWGEPWGPKTKDHCGVCALGALGANKGMSREELRAINPEDWENLGDTFDIAETLVREVMWVNDDHITPETSEERWKRVHKWVESNIVPSPGNAGAE